MSNHPQWISVISGTDRVDNQTEKVAEAYAKLLAAANFQHEHFRLRDLPQDFTVQGSYGHPGAAITDVIQQHIRPYGTLVFVIPEYNGSFPGILKLFIDLVPPYEFHGKRAALVGVSDGKSGNLRGLDHFAAILNYLRMDVLWMKPRVASIMELLNADGAFTHGHTLKLFQQQIELLR